MKQHEARPLDPDEVTLKCKELDPAKWPPVWTLVVGTVQKSATEAFEELKAAKSSAECHERLYKQVAKML